MTTAFLAASLKLLIDLPCLLDFLNGLLKKPSNGLIGRSSQECGSCGFALVVPSCLDVMIVIDLGLGADVIGVLPLKLAENMDWNNLVSWQHNSGYNSANNFPMMPTNFQSTHSPTQQFQHPAINYMMPIPPDPTPTKFMPPVMPPPVTTPQPTPPPGPPAALPVRPQKAWLTPSPDWTPGDGMFDVNQLYNFSLPMTVANTPHGNLRDMSGMDIRDVRLVQVIHGGLTNWLLRPFAHGRFVTWEGFRTRTEALLWSTCSKLLRRSQSINLLTLEKDLANSLGLNIDDFNQRIKVHDHLASLILQFLQQHHTSLTPAAQTDDMVKKYNDLNRAHERSKLSIPHRYALRPLPRWQAIKMMQSWLHRHRSTTHHPRHLPAPFLQPAQRPLMVSPLIARRNLGSFSLFTECRHHRPSRQRHNCSPCTARRMKLSSTTHGPVTSLAFISSNRLQPPLWRRWLSGPITRPGSTATSH